MLAFVSLLLLVIGQIASSDENCDKIEGLKPFNRHQIYECTFNGFFADETDRKCRQYVVCARNTRSFTTLYLTCPKGTYFNPDIEDCTSNYDCPYEDETESTTDISAACNYTSDHDYFRCYDSGNFANDNDPTCRSYFYCLVILKPNLYVQIKYTCSENFYFNPYTKTCDDKYVCSCSSSTSRPTSTTRRERTATSSIETTNHDVTSTYNGCDYIDDPDYFTCTVEGTFKNNNDRTCRSYYKCTNLVDGWIKAKYNCLGNTYFDPSKGHCNSAYKCPCSAITEQPAETTISPVVSEITSQQRTTNGESDTCIYSEDPNYFTCTVQGRFRNNNDKDCKSYYLCRVLRSGQIIQKKYDCPGNSLFNPKKQLCDMKYKCPCINLSTSTISTETSVETTTTINDETLSTQISTENTANENQSSSTSPSTTTTTTENSDETKPNDKCIYDDNPDYFTCTVKGRFRNNNDQNCKSYYLCSVLRSGRIIQTKYECPGNALFNPKKQLCDVKYKCPCYNPSTSTIGTNPATTEILVETTTTTINDDTLSTEISTENTSNENQSSSTSQSTTTTENSDETKPNDKCIYDDNPNYFTCTVKGRFRNNNDRNCKSYYLCSVLRSGRIIQTKYDCPGNSLFNPKKQLCDVKYKCPCTSTIDTTTIRTETSMETTTTTINDDTLSTQISTEKTTNEDQTSPTSPSITTTTENSSGIKPNDKCIYDDNPNYFTCTVKGRFRNNNDRNCKSYYLCSVLRSERIIQTKYDCPGNSLFNPKKQLCDVKYKCPCIEEFSTTISPTETSSTAETSSENSVTSMSSEEPEEASTSSEIYTTNTTKDHSTSNSASPRMSTPNQECVYDENPNYFTCTVPGRFRNNNDMECKSYYLCILLRSGRIYQTKYDCPGNSLFNPEKQLCDTEYKCPCYNPSTSTISTTTNETETSMKTTTTTANDDTLSTQISTEKTTNNDQSTSTLPTIITTETSNGTNPDDSCIYDDNPNYFTCTVKGRFRNNNDRECKSYYLCSVLRSGRIIQTKYDCPENSFFNPKKQLCDVKYKCPCTDELTTTTVGPTKTSRTAETTGSEDPEEASTSSEINTTNTTKDHSTANSASPRTSTINQECVYDENPNYFTCTVPGRFRNNNDMECKSYYLCILLRSGRIYQTKYDCPGNSLFNPEKQLCDTEYKCPCNNPSTSTISTTTIRAETSMETTTTTVNDDTLSTQISTEKTTNDDQSTSTLPTTITTEISNGTNPDDSCIYDDNPNYFTCTIKGRFRNNNDRECKSYYLCSVLRSGRIIQTKYDCPENSFFNPKKQLCDVKYKCPCTDELTTTTVGPTKTSRTAETTGSEDPEEASTSSEINTTNTTQDHSTANSASPRTSTINQECVYDENPNYFTCTVPGRFRNNNDMECKSYYLCILLRSGRIYQTKYDCPGNSLFNPEKQLCDTEYKCPCNNPSTSTISTTTIRTETSMETTTTTVNDDTLSTQISTEKTTNDDQSTSTLPTTITTEISNRTNPDDSCIYDDNPNYFTCTVKGRFRNNNDRECKSYYLCSVLRSGRIIQTKYDCPENSFFNPKKQLCDVKYKCPCTDELTTTTVGPTKTSRTAETTGSEDPEEASTSSEINTTNTTKDHSTTNSASPRMSTPNQECVYDENPNYFTCTVPGRFRNNNDMECKSYYLCILLRSGRIYQTKYDCPGNSLFNPEKQLCDTEYKCPCTTLTTIPTSTTNINTTETTIETAQTTTSTYLPDESTTTTTTITTILPTTTTILPTTAEENCAFYDSDPNYFICNRKGRFRNNNDKQCKTYFLCSKLRSGLFLKTKYLCPVNSFFNPGKSLCDVDYKCEC